MQSLGELATPPPPTPAKAVLQKTAAHRREPPRRRIPRLLASAAILLAVGALVSLASHRKATVEHKPSLVVRELKGPAVLRLKGTTQAILARSILAPMLSGQQVSSLTITRLVPAGTVVKKGALLVEFDRQAQIRDALDKQAEYNKLVDQVKEEQAKEKAARAKDETELHQAESELRKAELEMQKTEILSRIDAEKAQENFDQAKATVQQLQETFDLKRKAAGAAIRTMEIQRDRTHQTMLHAQANAELMQVHSPMDGVVVLNTIWKEGKMGEVQEGDQVRPGVPFMQMVDPSKMQVQVQVNQADLLSLRIGQSANVRLDAYPEMVFVGKLEQIAPIGRSGDFSGKVRTFTVVFSIQGNDPRLMPDLSAAVDVDISDHSDVASGSR